MLKNRETKKNYSQYMVLLEIILIALIVIFLGLMVCFANFKVDLTVPVQKITGNEIVISKKFIPYLPNNFKNVILKSGLSHYNFVVIKKEFNNQDLIITLNKEIKPQKVRFVINEKTVLNLILSK